MPPCFLGGRPLARRRCRSFCAELMDSQPGPRVPERRGCRVPGAGGRCCTLSSSSAGGTLNGAACGSAPGLLAGREGLVPTRRFLVAGSPELLRGSWSCQWRFQEVQPSAHSRCPLSLSRWCAATSLRRTFLPRAWGRAVVAQTAWPAEPGMFMLGSLQKKLPDSCLTCLGTAAGASMILGPSSEPGALLSGRTQRGCCGRCGLTGLGFAGGWPCAC